MSLSFKHSVDAKDVNCKSRRKHQAVSTGFKAVLHLTCSDPLPLLLRDPLQPSANLSLTHKGNVIPRCNETARDTGDLPASQSFFSHDGNELKRMDWTDDLTQTLKLVCYFYHYFCQPDLSSAQPPFVQMRQNVGFSRVAFRSTSPPETISI